ncbi:MAG: DUF1572 family protein [Saprospiraceae bacterium]|nr:DUF1572 family protein [Saprospiraceae bacterium]
MPKHNHQIESLKKLFLYYKKLGDKAMDQIDEIFLKSEPVEGINSIAIIVKHLSGNMLSRWTNYKQSDGEKAWRNRDSEFENPAETKEEVLRIWDLGWSCLFEALDDTKDAELDQTVYIRNEGLSIRDAIHRQLAHYAYHVGQIVYLAKMYKGEEWKSLSIPKNTSQQYNQTKFSRETKSQHWADEV